MAYKIKNKKEKYGIMAYKKKHIFIERNLNGSVTLSDGKNKKTYYGYSESQAIKLFKKEYK